MSDHAARIDHVGLKVTDLDKSRCFYVAALAPLGFSKLSCSQNHVSFGIGQMPYLTIRLVDTVAGTTHLALLAETRSQVDEFYAAGLAAGGRDFGAPGLRPEYHPDYYGAFLLDPDGHNIELVKHTPG